MTITQKSLDFSSHPQWNNQTGWLVFPWLEIFPNSSLLLGFHRLISIINQFSSLTLSG